MKKLFTFILAAVLVLSLVPAAYAATRGRHHQEQPACPVSSADCDKNFTDANNDGICDNRSENCGKTFADENADGVCDNRSNTACGGPVDADNDGVCDNRAGQGACGQQRPQGCHGKGKCGK